MKEITPEQLHSWYLEAVKKVNKDDFNPAAEKEYKDLTSGQKYIDKYIAVQINKWVLGEVGFLLDSIARRLGK